MRLCPHLNDVSQIRKVVAKPEHPVDVDIAHESETRTGILEREQEPPVVFAGVDRNHDGPEHERAEVLDHNVRVIERHDSDPVAGRNSRLSEIVGGLARLFEELAVGEFHPLAVVAVEYQKALLFQPVGLLRKQIADVAIRNHRLTGRNALNAARAPYVFDSLGG